MPACVSNSRFLVLKSAQSMWLSREQLLWREVASQLLQFVLSGNATVLGTLNSKLLAHGGPQVLFPSHKILFNAVQCCDADNERGFPGSQSFRGATTRARARARTKACILTVES